MEVTLSGAGDSYIPYTRGVPSEEKGRLIGFGLVDILPNCFNSTYFVWYSNDCCCCLLLLLFVVFFGFEVERGIKFLDSCVLRISSSSSFVVAFVLDVRFFSFSESSFSNASPKCFPPQT